MTSKARAYVRQNHLALIALMVAVVGIPTAWAVARDSVGSAQIKENAVRNSEIANNAVKSPEVADGSLLGQDFAAGQLPAGPIGPQGSPGPTGAQGIEGETGPAGSPDTGAEILSKLAGVDGTGSGLDADRVDGLSSASFLSSAAGAVDEDNVLDNSLGDDDLRVLATRAFSVFETVGGGPTVNNLDVGSFTITSSCEENPAGTVLAKVEITSSSSSWAMDSTAPGGADNQTGLASGAVGALASLGPTTSANYGVGSWSAAPSTGANGIVAVGVKPFAGADCYFNFSRFVD